MGLLSLATSSPANLLAIRGRRKRGTFFKNCSGDEVVSLVNILNAVQTINPTRCNNCNDLLHLNFTLKISVFSVAYDITQSNIYDGAFIVKIVSHSVHSQKSSIIDTRLGSKYASAFT